MADQFNYFYNFSSQQAAFLDPIIGPYLELQKPGLTDLWVYDLRNGGVVTVPVYWCAVLETYPPPQGNALIDNFGNNLIDNLGNILTDTFQYTLATSANLQFIVDRDLQIATGRGVIVSNISNGLLNNLQVVTPYGPYVTRGLSM